MKREIGMKNRLDRRIGIALIVLGMTAALTACGGKPAQETTAAASSAAAETTAAPAAETTAPAAESQAAETTAAPKAETTAAAETEAELKLPDYAFTFENFPRMDGSTATVPLAKAVAGALLKTDPEKTAELAVFNRTTQSFRNLLAGEKDILIVGEPKASVFEEMDAAGFKYEIEEIATDALIFVVNEKNPVDSLTTEQIRDIYTGKITNWKEVGGNDEEIIPFQRNEGAGSQALMVKLVMKDTPLMEAPTEYISTSMGDLMTAVKSYDNSANAIGYSVYYYANDMKMAKGLKIIAVDGVQPEPDTIRARQYPHLNAYYCVIPENTECEGARVIYDWLMTEDGQSLTAAQGYVSVLDVSGKTGLKEEGSLPKANYTRLDNAPEGTLTELKERDDYGLLIPYNGNELYESYDYELEEESERYVSGYMKGFFDSNGRLVTDPVYNEIEQIRAFDAVSGLDLQLPFYRVTSYDSDVELGENSWDIPSEAVHQIFVSLDGTIVSKEYGYISGFKDHMICKSSYESGEFEIYDKNGKVVLTDKQMEEVNGDEFTGRTDPDYGVAEVTYGEGYYVMSMMDGYYFVDAATAKICYGPYSYAMPFSQGKAFVRYSDFNKAGIINKEGEDLLGEGYDDVGLLANGNIIAGDGERADLYDKNGRLVKSFENSGYTSKTEWGFMSYPKNADDTNGQDCYDCNGKLLFSDPEAVYTIDYHFPVYMIRGDAADADAAAAAEAAAAARAAAEDASADADAADASEDAASADASGDGSGLWIGDLFTDKSIFLKGMESCSSFYTLEGFVEAPYLHSISYDVDTGANHSMVLSDQLEVLVDEQGYISPEQDTQSGEWYFLLRDEDSGNVKVLDPDLGELINLSGYPEIYGEIFVVTEDKACRAFDKDGKELFCYPMIGSLGN